MLYVFQMDVGQMLTFEISLLMDTVSTLQQELARVTAISVDKQILLVSGGHSLKPQQKVISYGAGTDTNPVFLFSKQAIESQEPPLVKSFGISKEVLGALKDRITEAVNLPAAFDTVTKRTKLACEIRDNANRMLAFCSNEFKEQHLQYQGWGTVVANLEEIAQAMQKTELKFKKAFTGFLPQREKYFKMLENFHETISLLDRIPLLKSLKDKERDEVIAKRDHDEGIISFVASAAGGPTTLLEWITTQGQGQSIESLRLKCFDDLHLFDSDMFAQLDREVQEQLSLVTDDPHHMKELMGIERRLSELEKRLNEAKRITQEQNDMAQGFLNQQSRLSSTQSPALIIPDLCRSHQQQLKQMLDRQQRIETLQNNFKKSKQEMSTNIHQRLGWVMHIETRISKLDSDLIYHMKTLRMLECNLELLSQIKAAPQVYADMVVEAARRRLFSSRFTQWAEALVDDSKQMYLTETERRKQFTRKLGEHFLLDTLFKGFDDMPPSFATRTPPPFDTHLPEVTVDDISLLRSTVPELEEFLNISVDTGSFSLSLLSKIMCESPQLQMVMPQSSQTEWSYQSESMAKPCIIVATEAPPTKFTLPEVHESLATEYLPVVPSLTDTARNVVATLSKPVSDHSSVNAGEATSESSSSAVAFEPGPAVQSVKTQTKTNSTHTDSTSPISSNEFATADFYFEDSMPSPMADSPMDKREEEKQMEDVKPEIDSIASLQAELAEKVALIQVLELKLKEKDVQLSDSEKLSSQKGSSTDESSTLLATVDILDMTAASSDSGDAVSGDFYSTVFETRTDVIDNCSRLEPPGEVDNNLVVGESVVTGSINDIPQSSTPSVPCSAESIQIRNLEAELTVANSDLLKLKQSLLDAEARLVDLLQENEKVVCDKDCVVISLQNQLTSVNEELLTVKNVVESKTEVIKKLENSLAEVRAANEQMKQEITSGNESLEKLKNRFLELIEKVKNHLPSLKHSLAELRTSVVEARSDLDSTVSAAVGSVESQISLFNNYVLSNVQGEFENEREQLRSEIQKLKIELHQSHSDASEKVVHLTSINEELLSQAEKHKTEFALKYEEQRRDFDAALKDLETKNILEMEIELDKVRGEVRDSLEEVERLNRLKDDLHQELREVKQSSEKQKDDIEKAHREEVTELKSTHCKDKEDTIALLNLKSQSDLEEKEQEWKSQVAEIEARLESVRASLVSEKESAIAALNIQINNQQEAALAELKEQMKNHEANLSEELEKRQLAHAHKLTQLKTSFDMERESLVAEIHKLVNWEKSHTGSQTEHHLLADALTNSDTQTEIVHVTEVMAHSETQTGMELLADVISLTSSASYGSEEMIAHKQLSTLTDDKDSKESETVSKMHQIIDDLSVQLARAQERIAIMEGDLVAVHASQQGGDGAGLERKGLMRADSTHRDFMQTGSVTASFMIMDKEPSSLKIEGTDEESTRAKDKRIAELEKKLMELSMTASERETTADKVSIRGCDKGDLVLLCLDERHDQYVVFTVGTILHFLHSESHETLGLKTCGETTCRKSWILAEVVDKEYCLAKKPNNRFRVPQGTCFYRVKCRPWKCDSDAGRLDREASRHIKAGKHDPRAPRRSEKYEEPTKY